MTAQDFYKEFILSKKVTLLGDPSLILSRSNIEITSEVVTKDELGNFFAPRYVDSEDKLILNFEDVKNSNAKLVTLEMAIQNPEKFDLEVEDRILPEPSKLLAVPIATDSKTDRTIVLDSNHTLVNLRDKISSIPVVRLRGPGLEKIFNDFAVINSQINI